MKPVKLLTITDSSLTARQVNQIIVCHMAFISNVMFLSKSILLHN